MKLKRVRLFGFKTFADRTEFEVDADIIAVVGPNGCGKSNIVDAMLWGLGEHNARNLRAQTSQEVIFAGSSMRKPLGYAEVTLLFDNEDGSLPIDASEVSITRRLSRSGDSDYAINRRSCRLKDVVDLLADTGLGRTGYAIVGQQDIDQALAASPVQRRAWVDEAAGVMRYRIRRNESMRRLDGADAHLARLHDILREVEAQRAPLEQEAHVARQYKQALGALREVESGLLAKEVAQSVDELEDLAKQSADAEKLASDELARAEALARESRRTRQQIVELDARLEALRQAAQQAETDWERAKAAVTLAESRLTHLESLSETMGQEAEAAQARLKHAQEELDAATGAETAERTALEALREETGRVDAESVALNLRLLEAEQAYGEAQAREAKRQRAEVEAEHRHERLERLEEELAGIEDTRPQLEAGLTEAQGQVDEAEEALAAVRARVQQSREQLAELARKEEAQAVEQRKLLAEVAALEGRRRGLQATIDTHEGLAQGSRAVLLAVENGLLNGEYVPVAQAVQIEPDLARAIDVALGAGANDLIVPDEAHAKRAIELLKERMLGRATFQAIPLMRPVSVGPELRDLARERGVVGLAGELVSCEPRYRAVIDSLLGRVLVVETLDDALRLARTRGWSRIVTVDGEVVHAGGGVTGGRSAAQGAGMVQRRAELGELEGKIDALRARVRSFEKDSAGRDAERQRIQARRQADEQALQAAQAESQELRDWLNSLKQEMAAMERERARVQREVEALASASPAPMPGEDLTPLRQVRDEALQAVAARAADAETSMARLREAETRAATARKRVDEARRRLAQAEEGEEGRAKRAQGLGPDRERAHLAIEEARVAVARSAEARSRAAESLAASVAERAGLVSLAEKQANEADVAGKAAGACSDRVHQCDLVRARVDARRAASLQRLLEEYGIDQEEALRVAPLVVVPDDAATLVQRLRRELKGMGEVNLGAIEAYERLTERFEHLNGEVQDVLNGKAEVEAAIRELDRLTREKFADTFERLQGAFRETFQSMFGGGEGELRLENPADLLDSGVEIEVTIPGKRRQRLELLSGGERAMSGLAFLFALLRVKPTPLVILDEVDAPLDGRNVERFIATMREFTGQTQFVLITHNTVTMESAEVWYGVTMQEPGVSTLIPCRLPAAPVGA